MLRKNHVNVVVIGSGAGGGVVAKELSFLGYSVVLFERGKWVSYNNNSNDELSDQRNQILGANFWVKMAEIFQKNEKIKNPKNTSFLYSKVLVIWRFSEKLKHLA